MVTRPAWASSFRWKDRELRATSRSEEHTSELQSRLHLVCRLLLEKKEKLMDGVALDSIKQNRGLSDVPSAQRSDLLTEEPPRANLLNPAVGYNPRTILHIEASSRA